MVNDPGPAYTREGDMVNTADSESWAAVVAGDAPLTWRLWVSPLSQSSHLTPRGVEAAQALMEGLASFLGDDWLERSRRGPEGCPLMSMEWWPANDTVHVARNLLNLGVQVAIARTCPGIQEVRQSVRDNPKHLFPALQQIEIANLAYRDGFGIRYEPALDSGKFADVEIRKRGRAHILESTEIGLDNETRAISRFTDVTIGRIMAIEREHGVQITGEIGAVLSGRALDYLFERLERVSQRVKDDGREVLLPTPVSGQLRITRGGGVPGRTLSGPRMSSDEWSRLASRIERKAIQTRGSRLAWIYIVEGGSLWYLTPWARSTLAEKLATAVMQVEPLIDRMDHLAGVILSNSWAWDAPQRANEQEWFPDGRAVALHQRRALGRSRETIIIASPAAAREGMLRGITGWFVCEASWLDWGLSKLGLPPANTLLRPR